MGSSGDMAHKLELEGIKKVNRDTEQKKVKCAVCLLPSLYPTILHCGHIFCYLCIKKVVRTGLNTCPPCRSEIPANMLFKPILYEPLSTEPSSSSSDDSLRFKWFYKRRKASGFWEYDNITSEVLEEAFKNGKKLIDVTIAGFKFTIDFRRMLQIRKHSQQRRKIRRALCGCPVGIAGIRNKNPHHQHFPSCKLQRHWIYIF